MVRGCWCDITYSVSSKEFEFETILSINVDVLEILVGKNIRGNKRLELKSIDSIIYWIWDFIF